MSTKSIRKFVAISAAMAAGALLAVASPASAALMLVDPAPVLYQHTVNSPCIITTVNCPQQPAGFDSGFVVTNGSTTDWTTTDGTAEVVEYTVGQIRDIVGDDFIVGIDVSQTGGSSGDQTLDWFYWTVNDVIIDTYTNVSGPGNVGVTENPGNGFADWILTGFSLVGLDDGDTVKFFAEMSDLNDGPEQFFIHAADGGTVIPVPAAAWLFLTGIAGLFGFRRFRATTA